MASLRKLKREIDYLVSEVISDCYACLAINSKCDKGAVFGIIEDAVELRNNLFDKANRPAEKHNPHLVKKHYRQLIEEMFDGVDKLFVRLSEVCKDAK